MSTNIGRKERNDRAATTYSTDSYVQSFQNLPGRPHADKAIPLLQKIASLVKPIMRSHGWRLPLLSEFFPDNPSLVGLNVNGGQQILLRLRPHWAPNTFYSEEELIGVMLHELTHNVHGPHDQQFYKYLAGLEREYDDLQRTGYAGEGFYAPGERLGKDVSHNIPMTEAKRRAREAAERRAKTAGSGVNRLGGKGWTTSLLMKTPGQLAAEAAERRMHDEKACAHDEEADVEAAKAARDGSRHDIADLPHVNHDDIIVIDSDSDSDVELLSVSTNNAAPGGPSRTEPAPAPNKSKQQQNVANSSSGASTSKLPPARPRAVLAQPPSQPASSSSSQTTSNNLSSTSAQRITTQSAARPSVAPEPESKPKFVEWPCDTCTYVNHPQRVTCEMCFTKRSGQASTPAPTAAVERNNTSMSIPKSQDPDAWDCAACGERGMPGGFWTCRFCGHVKLTS